MRQWLYLVCLGFSGCALVPQKPEQVVVSDQVIEQEEEIQVAPLAELALDMGLMLDSFDRMLSAKDTNGRVIAGVSGAGLFLINSLRVFGVDTHHAGRCWGGVGKLASGINATVQTYQANQKGVGTLPPNSLKPFSVAVHSLALANCFFYFSHEYDFEKNKKTFRRSFTLKNVGEWLKKRWAAPIFKDRRRK